MVDLVCPAGWFVVYLDAATSRTTTFHQTTVSIWHPATRRLAWRFFQRVFAFGCLKTCPERGKGLWIRV